MFSQGKRGHKNPSWNCDLDIHVKTYIQYICQQSKAQISLRSPLIKSIYNVYPHVLS